MKRSKSCRNTRSPLPARVALVAALLAPGAGAPVQAQSEVVENADRGAGVSLRIGDREVSLPADTAAAIVAALREHSGDPEGLRAELRDLAAASAAAAGCGDEAEENAARCVAFMTAVVLYAVLESGAGPADVAAIVEGVAAGVPAIDPQALIDTLAAVEEAEADAQSTTEEPRSTSPVQ